MIRQDYPSNDMRMSANIFLRKGLYLKTILFPIFILIAFNQDVNSQIKDFFPLKIGSSFVYSYHVEDDMGYDFLGSSDWGTNSWKGTVAYFVTDSSSQGDTLTLWSILEKDSLFYRFQDSYGTQDSSFTVDTSHIQLTEMTSGLHLLYANTSIWNFQRDVSRYRTDTSNIDIIQIRGQTMTFKQDSGLVTLKYINGTGGNHWEIYSKDFELLSISSPLLYRKPDERTPLDYSLDQNYPNPFNPTTLIRFSVPRETKLTLRIYDLLGRLIDTIVDNNMQAGHHTAIWNASKKASGIYFCILQTEDISKSIKLVLIK
jgi:hypothetical protein